MGVRPYSDGCLSRDSSVGRSRRDKREEQAQVERREEVTVVLTLAH